MLGHIETLSWARITPDNENNINLEYILTNSSATLSYKYIYIGTLNNYNMLHTNILKLDEGSTWYEDDTDIFNQDLTYEVATSSYLFKDGLLFKIPNKSGDQITVYNIVNSSVSSIKTKNRTTTQDKYNILRFRLKFTDADKLNYCLEGSSNETNLQDVFVQATQTTSLDSIECYDNLKASEFKDMVVIAANIDPDEDILNFGNRQGIHITYRDWSENKSYLSQNQTNFYWKSLFPYHRTYQFTYPLLNHPILLPYNLSNESNDWYLEITMKKPPTNCFSYCLIGNGFNFDETDESPLTGWNSGLSIEMNSTTGNGFTVTNYGYISGQQKYYSIYESNIPTNQYTTISIRYNQDTSSKKSDKGNLVDVFIDGVKAPYTPPGTIPSNFNDNLGSLREILIHSTNVESNHQYTDNEDLGSIEINFGPNWKYPDLAQDLIDKDVSTIDYDTPTITISPYQFNVSMTLTEFSNLLQSKTGVVNIEKASTQMSLGKLVLTFSGGNELKNGASMLVSDDDDSLAGINYSSIDSDNLTASGLNNGSITNSNSSGNINNGELSFTYYYGLQPTPKTSLTGNKASVFYVFLAINSNGSAYNKSGEFDVVIPGITYDLYVKTTDIDEEAIPTTITPNITIHFTITQPEIEYIKQNVLKGHNFLLKESSGGGAVNNNIVYVEELWTTRDDSELFCNDKGEWNYCPVERVKIPIPLKFTLKDGEEVSPDNNPEIFTTNSNGEFDITISSPDYGGGGQCIVDRLGDGLLYIIASPIEHYKYSYPTDLAITAKLKDDNDYVFENGTKIYRWEGSITSAAPKKIFTITGKIGDYSKQAGTADPAFTCSYEKDKNSPCYYDGSEPSFTGQLSRDPGETADTYIIHQGTLELANNGLFQADYYNLIVQEGQLTINSAPSILKFSIIPSGYRLTSEEFNDRDLLQEVTNREGTTLVEHSYPANSNNNTIIVANNDRYILKSCPIHIYSLQSGYVNSIITFTLQDSSYMDYIITNYEKIFTNIQIRISDETGFNYINNPPTYLSIEKNSSVQFILTVFSTNLNPEASAKEFITGSRYIFDGTISIQISEEGFENTEQYNSLINSAYTTKVNFCIMGINWD